MLLGFKADIYIITKLKKYNKATYYCEINLRLNFLVKKKKASWCKCLLSGFKGENFLLSFLKIENKFSKQGYHINDIKSMEKY